MNSVTGKVNDAEGWLYKLFILDWSSHRIIQILGMYLCMDVSTTCEPEL